MCRHEWRRRTTVRMYVSVDRSPTIDRALIRPPPSPSRRPPPPSHIRHYARLAAQHLRSYRRARAPPFVNRYDILLYSE
jgi:hypothetical protein